MKHLQTVPLAPTDSSARQAFDGGSTGNRREISTLILLTVCFAGMMLMLLLSGCSMSTSPEAAKCSRVSATVVVGTALPPRSN